MLVFGGRTGAGDGRPLNDMHRFVFATGTWSAVVYDTAAAVNASGASSSAAPPAPRSKHSMVYVPNAPFAATLNRPVKASNAAAPASAAPTPAPTTELADAKLAAVPSATAPAGASAVTSATSAPAAPAAATPTPATAAIASATAPATSTTDSKATASASAAAAVSAFADGDCLLLFGGWDNDKAFKGNLPSPPPFQPFSLPFPHACAFAGRRFAHLPFGVAALEHSGCAAQRRTHLARRYVPPGFARHRFLGC
jgi:hypothetical protein